MTAKPLPPAQFLRECFDYDPQTGELFWKARPVSHFRDEVCQRRWNTTYAGTLALATMSDGSLYGNLTYQGRRQKVRAHRVIWKLVYGSEPENEVDHRDGDFTNNQLLNLRDATRFQNNQNTRMRRHNRTGFKGVSPVPSGRFKARIRVNNTVHQLGTFNTPEEARQAYVEAAHRYHKEFANVG